MPESSRAFDEVRPPEPDLLDACVHCGFCLPSCPTYVLWGEEMDSPRGRIALMKQGLEAGSVLDEDTVLHLDRCLGCMACVTGCPSGVQYDRLIEDARAQVERRHDRTRRERLVRRLVFALFPHPRRLRPLVWLLPLARRYCRLPFRPPSGLSRSPNLPFRRLARSLASPSPLTSTPAVNENG